MDSENLSATILRELGDLFVATLTQVGPELLRTDLDGMEQRLQDLSRRVLGDVVEAVVRALAATPAPDRPLCPTCHRPMRLVDQQRVRHLQGLVGDYTLRRAYFVCDPCQRGRAPLDERLGLGPGALSPGLARVACRLGIEDAFGESPDALEEMLRVNVPREAVRRITEGIGEVAERAEHEAIGRAQAGKEPLGMAGPLVPGAALLVEADGALVHLQDDWHEVKVGVAAPLGPATRTDPATGRTTLVTGRPSYCAGFEAAEAFWYRLYVATCRQGLEGAGLALIVVLGDGADGIWHYAARFLAVGTAEIVEIVDIYHAWEHLGTVASAMFGPGSAAALAWSEPLKRALQEEGVGPILAALGALTPAEPSGAEEVRKAIGYFTAHAARMDYPAFIARRLPIGSGAVESACKTLIEEREKGAGMRWTKAGAQAVATLRALQRSGRWGAFWATHPQRRRPAVFPRQRTTAAPPSQPLKQAA
jgi:hypothetical protein